MSAKETPLETLKQLLTNRSPSTALGSTRFLSIVSVFSLPAKPLPEACTLSKPQDSPVKSTLPSALNVVVIEDEELYTVPSKRHQLPAFLPKTAKKTCLESRR